MEGMELPGNRIQLIRHYGLFDWLLTYKALVTGPPCLCGLCHHSLIWRQVWWSCLPAEAETQSVFTIQRKE